MEDLVDAHDFMTIINELQFDSDYQITLETIFRCDRSEFWKLINRQIEISFLRGQSEGIDKSLEILKDFVLETDE
jgi:hypothetical protein